MKYILTARGKFLGEFETYWEAQMYAELELNLMSYTIKSDRYE